MPAIAERLGVAKSTAYLWVWHVRSTGTRRRRGNGGASFQRTTQKRDRPQTRRRHVGVDYRGCLAGEAPRSSRNHWWIEGSCGGWQARNHRWGGKVTEESPARFVRFMPSRVV
jgi:hypothetical protein